MEMMGIPFKVVAKGLNKDSWRILSVLSEVANMPAKELMEKVGLSSKTARFYKEIARLEGAALIARARGKDDFRVVAYQVTEYAARVLELR